MRILQDANSIVLTCVWLWMCSSVLEELLQEKIAHQTRATGDQYTQYVNDVAKARAYTTFIVDKKKVLRDDIYKSMDDGESGGVENYNGRVR